METYRVQPRMNIIVIGAGLAGVTAALRLSDAGHRVTVYERNQFLGGRAASAHDETAGHELDFAQHVFLYCCPRYRALLERLDTAKLAPLRSPFNIPVIDANTYPEANSIASLRASSLPTGLHLAPSFLRFTHLTWRERMQTARTVLKLARIDRTKPKYSTQTFADWLRTQGESDNAVRSFWDVIIIAALNSASYDVSASWGIMLFQEALLEHRRGPEVGIPTVPLSQLLTPAEKALSQQSGRIQTSQPVRSVLVADDGTVQGVTLADGQKEKADAVILATGHRDVTKLLPPSIRDNNFFSEIDELPTNAILDLHIGFSQADFPVPPDFGVFLNSPIQWFFWHDDDHGKRLSISISNPGELASKRAADVENMIVAEARRLFQCPMPDWVIVRRNKNATFSVAPGNDKYRRPQKTPIDGLYVAGDWTDTGWPATMEGAVRSGEFAADAVLQDATGPKSPR